jgi:ABC-2 type transport system ATP-binding protein
MNTEATLDVRNLRVAYGTMIAVHDVTFSLHPGEIFGLLGPNGAGKTSTLSAIEGLLTPAAGSVFVVGYDIHVDMLEARANLGIQLQSTSFQQDLTVREIIELYAGLYGLALSRAHIDALIADMRLEGRADARTGQLSGGQLQRLTLSIATLHDPPLVLLDEPTTGLDPQSRRQLWERIEAMRDAGRSILLTTHSMEEASAICDRVGIIDHGKLLVIDAPDNLVETHKNDPEVQAVARRGTVTLEDVFIGLTGREVRT